MRWHFQRRPVLALFILILCLFAFFGSDRFPFTNDDLKLSSRSLPIIKANFTKLSDNAFAYFAVDDFRNGNMGYHFLRILVIATSPKVRFHCRFPSGTEVPANGYEMSENHGMTYGVYYANCRIPDGESLGATIEVSEETAATWVPVPITYRIDDEHMKIDYELDYATCVPVLFGDKYTPKRLVEFMELNSLLGSKRVTLYADISNINSELMAVIKYYRLIGLIQVIDFVLPFPPAAIWYHGQLAVITDCLVRHTGVAQYLGFHDLDEFIVPQEKLTVPEELNESLSGNIGSLRIPTQYTSAKEMEEAALISLNAFQHPPLDHTFTKCVLRPEMVFEQGIHHTSRVIQDAYKSPNADVKKLRLFHFKSRGGHLKNTRLVDVYGTLLQQNFDLVTKYLGL